MNASASGPALLVVDDEAMVLVTLKVILEREGYRVTTSDNPEQALGILKQGNFGVVVSDHRMPGMVGLDFLRECRRLKPDTSRVLLTAVLNLKEVLDAISKGDICRFVAKPWLREELLAAISDAVARHELTARNSALLQETARLNQLLEAARAAAPFGSGGK